MDMKAKGIIASLPAVKPAVGKNGPQMGFNAANAISDALAESGYKVVLNKDLKKVRDGMADVLKMLEGK